MRLRNKAFACILVVFSLLTACVCAAEYSINDLNINNISLPDNFYSCSRTECNPTFSSILSANGYTFQSWQEKVMIPQNIYICGRDNSGKTINVTISDPSTAKDKEENIKYHRLMYDYNLYSSSPKTKEKALVKYRNSLIDAGVNKRTIKRIKWIEKEDLSDITPYVFSIYKNKDNLNVCEWNAIYDGNLFSFSVISETELSNEEISSMSEYVRKINFANVVDYSQAKQVYRQNQRVKLPERLNVKQKRSRIFVGTALGFISLVILSAIAITTTKIRKRTKSSRNSRSGRY